MRAGKETALLRSFTTFPGGGPGLALVLLRATLGLTGIAEGVSCLHNGIGFASQLAGFCCAVAGAFLSLGLFTPISAVAVAFVTAGQGLLRTAMSAPALLQGPLAPGIEVALGIAVALLGPGLFSLDACLFGRREIIIPRRSRE